MIVITIFISPNATIKPTANRALLYQSTYFFFPFSCSCPHHLPGEIPPKTMGRRGEGDFGFCTAVGYQNSPRDDPRLGPHALSPTHPKTGQGLLGIRECEMLIGPSVNRKFLSHSPPDDNPQSRSLIGQFENPLLLIGKSLE